MDPCRADDAGGVPGVVIMGPALTKIPLDLVQLVVGALLVLFGLRWLRKAILRSAGVLPLHDEDALFAKETETLRRAGGKGPGFDKIGAATAFKITMLEGIEVVFIVIAIGAAGPGLLAPACVGAAAALVLVVALGLVLHRPVATIPENALKFVVGVLLAAFGTFWVGEGIGLAWPGADWSLLTLTAGYLAAAYVAVAMCRKRSGTALPGEVR